MHAIRYFFTEAAASIWRGRRAALLAVVTIAAGLFVLGFLLVVNANLQRLVGRWTETAELSIYLRDEASAEQLKAIDEVVARSGLAAARAYVSREQAAERFRQDFPDLAPSAGQLAHNPFPASFEVRLDARAGETAAAVDMLATTVRGMAGVADVRFDRDWLDRLNTIVRFVRGMGLLIVILLAFASALTVANVVRLAVSARRDEIEIMQLVGAPFAYVRGPFIVEGILQGGAGALVAVLLLWGLFAAMRARYGQMAADAVGLTNLSFLPAELWLAIVFGGMLLGCIGGVVVARGVR